MDGDREGCVMAAIVALVLIGCVCAFAYDATVARPRRCSQSVLHGEVQRLDWSGGWASGVLIEFDTGSRIVRGRGALPAVGDRAYVCKNNHVHGGDPHPR